jgi:aryl-alcohol dehydrogenase-like predicted oxidoreductase
MIRSNSGKRAAGHSGHVANETALIAGRATTSGTQRFANRFQDTFAPDFFRNGAPGVTLSSIGMGTYLGECDDHEDDRYATVLALGIASGINVLDTAINYRCQRSERAVGRAVHDAITAGTANRDELFICTKGGYVPLEGAPPESREEYDGYLTANYFAKSVMSREDLVAGGHCLTPRFLSDQIERSRKNLGVECIDLFYLHNPEQQLDTLNRTRFREVMRTAFAELESHVARGSISAYGCATWNGFRVFAANRSHLSLSELIAIAEEVGGKSHHFRFVQLPINLAMTEAIRLPTQAVKGKNLSVLDLAKDAGISVVASASLMQAQLTHDLPDAVKSLFPGLTTDAQRALAFVRSLPIATSLVGMRSHAHLSENLEAGRTAIRA